MSVVEIYKITQYELTEEENMLGVVRVDPIIGNAMSAGDYFSKILVEYNKRRRILTPSELGCSLSHLHIYRLAKERKSDAIIFEEDIEIKRPKIDIALEIISAFKPSFCHLGIHPNFAQQDQLLVKKTPVDGVYELCKSFHIFGTYAYYVDFSTCTKLIDFHSGCIRRADAWGDFFSRNKDLRTYCSPLFKHPSERGELNISRNKIDRLDFKNYTLNDLLIKFLHKFNRLKCIANGGKRIKYLSKK